MGALPDMKALGRLFKRGGEGMEGQAQKKGIRREERSKNFLREPVNYV